MPRLSAERVAVFAISYDRVEILGRFAAEHGIDFPLLSDGGSAVIRRLGLLNERVHDDHAAYGVAPNPRHLGVPYPGVFVLDEKGVIARKRFHASYRERDTGAGLVASALGMTASGNGPASEWRADGICIRASLDSPTYCWFQRLRLDVSIVLADGFQIHGRYAAEGCVPVSLQVAPLEGVEVGEVQWPEPRRVADPEAPDECWIHQGTVRASVPLTFTAPAGGGDRLVQVAVTYQPRDRPTSLGPSTVHLELPVKEVALVGRTLPSRT